MNIFAYNINNMTLQKIEKDIKQALKSNSSKAFELIYINYFADLCVYALRFLNDSDDAQDIVQQTLIQLWEKNEKLQNTEYLRTYIFHCVHNACLNKIRDIKIKPMTDSEEYLHTLKMEFTDELISEEQCVEIEEAISQLPTQCRTVFELNRLQGLSYKEIATQLNISHRTVDSHLTNATKQLRKKLKALVPAGAFLILYIIHIK